jgi:hypothetical protein
MGQQYQTAKVIITEIVDKSLRPLARSAGFTKSHFNFHRRRGEVVQVMNVQLSQWNFAADGGFFINIGIALDRLCELDGETIQEKPSEVMCHFRPRIAFFCPGAPDQWRISALTNTDEMADRLSTCCVGAIAALDTIDSVSSLLAQAWFRPGADYLLQARLHYVLNQDAEALHYVQLAADFFSDRQNSTVPAIIKRLHLARLDLD